MGALEFRPGLRTNQTKAEHIDIGRLVELASMVLAERNGLAVEFDEEGLNDILRVGTSAGGARAKAVIVWNETTNEVRSGQVDAPAGFEHWLLKFDGVSESFDGVADPQGYGRIEYAYFKMAQLAGIKMSDCRLFQEDGRAHFMTRRFDRPAGGGKIHYASLFGLAHMAYSAPGAQNHSYEDYFAVIEQLDIEPSARLEAFRRMVFNVLGCNRDDHTKNFGFMMDDSGRWNLAPAFDVTYAHNPKPGKWTASQQMSIMGKRENITRDDLIAIGRNSSVATVPKLSAAIDQVFEALRKWRSFAAQVGVGEKQAKQIEQAIGASSFF